MRIFLRLAILVFLVFSGARAAESLTAENLTETARAQIGAYAREALKAVMDGRAAVAPADIAAAVTQAQGGAEVAVIRDGRLVASGHSLGGDSFLGNLRLAAGRAVFNFKVADLDQCAVAVAALGEGKTAAVPAPVYKWARGREAAVLENGGKSFYVGVFSPLLRQQDWESAVNETLKERLPNSDAKARLEFLTAPAAKLRVFPASLLVAAPGGKTTLLSGDEGAPARADALKAAGAWWLANQAPSGEYLADYGPGADNTAAVPGNALAAATFGMLWRQSGDKAYRLAGLKTLDWLLLNWFLEAPGTDYGYLTLADKTVNTGVNGVFLWAAALLDVPEDDSETARCRGKIEKFLLAQRQPDGFIRPWLQPAGSRKGMLENQLWAVIGLMARDAAKHAPAMSASLAVARREFSQPGKAGLYAAMLSARAELALYAATRQQEFSANAAAPYGRLLDDVRAGRVKIDTAYAAGEWACGLGQVARAQKLLGAAAPLADKAEDFRAEQAAALRLLAGLQVIPGGGWAAILPGEKKYAGAFLPAFGEFTVDLPAMLCGTWALLEAE